MENNILSSIALFSELYKNNKDIYLIIGEFVKASIKVECKYAFTDVQMQNMLNRNFNINIPQPLVSYILRNKLKSDIARRNGQYIVSNPASLNGSQFSEQQKNLQNDYEDIFLHLCKYIEIIKTTKFTENEQDKIKIDFINYLLKQGNSDYSDIFSAFILSNQFSQDFTNKLNCITEGLVVYSGIQYKSPEEINQLGKWKNQLTIYLDTEQLFNLIGYNDEYYKKIFDDFFNLVTEINRKSEKKILHLKYFNETQEEIDRYFSKAERIVTGKEQLIPGRIAMLNIINGCKDEYDVKAQKSKFFTTLRNSGVNLDDETKIKNIRNIGSVDLLSEIENDFKTKKLDYNEDEAVRYTTIFSKINSLRNGVNNTPFEKCSYIFLSANGFVRYLSCFENIKQDRGTPFATDIDYVTSRMWFDLQKPFTVGTTPTTFDIISRSQLVLKSHYNKTIHKRYEELIAKDMPSEAKIDIYKELHCKGAITAKDITKDSIPEIISFIEMSSIDILLEEKAMFKAELEDAKKISLQYEVEKVEKQKMEQLANVYAEENSLLKEKNKKNDRLNRHLKYTPIKRKIRWNNSLILLGLYFILLLLIGLIILFIYWLKQENDTILTVIASILAIAVLILPFFKQCRMLALFKIRKNSVSTFKKRIYIENGKKE